MNPPALLPVKKALLALAFAATFLAPHPRLSAAGPEPVNLGGAARFTILAGATITTTGGGIINGDIGASPITGAAIHLTQAQVNGAIYCVDSAGPAGSIVDAALLLAAKGDLTTAYNDAAGRVPVPSGPFLNPGAGNIGGMNLVPGLYKFTGTTSIAGSDLTLTGGPNDVWIFQIAADLQVGSGRKVILAGGAQPSNIFWQVGTSAVIGTFAVFNGTILADQSVIMNTSSSMNGRALAFSAGVTFNGTGGDLPATEPVKFLSITEPSPGAVALVIQTVPSKLTILQTSTTLQAGSWTTIASETLPTEIWNYTHDARLATGRERFYRAYISY